MTCYGSVYKTIYTSYQLRFLWASYNSIQFLSPATNKGGKSGAWNQCVFSSVLSRSKASYKGLLSWHCFTQSYFWTTLFWSIAVQLYLHYFPCFLCIHELFGWPVWLMYTCFWISPSLNWENPAPMYCRFLLLGFILVLYFSFILAVLLFEFVWMVFFTQSLGELFRFLFSISFFCSSLFDSILLGSQGCFWFHGRFSYFIRVIHHCFCCFDTFLLLGSFVQLFSFPLVEFMSVFCFFIHSLHFCFS